ncbi:MAG: hypothetical protein PUB67_03345 [Clostridiales bacterium]|nr:hypothetical protein [Clostridiales bacterium]
MKKKLIIIFILAFMSVGIVAAYMLREQTVDNKFTPAVYSCEAVEVFNNNTKSEIKVKNTGNVAGYVRVKLITYWVDSDGNNVGVPSEDLSIDINEPDHWSRIDDTFYYDVKVEPGSMSPNLLGTGIVLKEKVYNGKTVYQAIDVIAEISQKNLRE